MLPLFTEYVSSWLVWVLCFAAYLYSQELVGFSWRSAAQRRLVRHGDGARRGAKRGGEGLGEGRARGGGVGCEGVLVVRRFWWGIFFTFTFTFAFAHTTRRDATRREWMFEFSCVCYGVGSRE